MSSWLAMSWIPAIFFKFNSVALNISLAVWRCCAAWSPTAPPASWMEGSEVPPWRTTIFGGGQTVGALAGAGLAVPAFVGLWAASPDGALGTAVVSVEAGTQFDAACFFFRRGRAATGSLAGGVCVWGDVAAFVGGDELCAGWLLSWVPGALAGLAAAVD
jgi:hypothetical protein